MDTKSYQMSRTSAGPSYIQQQIKPVSYTHLNYEKDANGKSNTYLATVYKADDAFWLIQYCCPTDDYQKMEPGFIEWAQTVTFA